MHHHSPSCDFKVNLPNVSIRPVHSLPVLDTPVAQRLPRTHQTQLLSPAAPAMQKSNMMCSSVGSCVKHYITDSLQHHKAREAQHAAMIQYDGRTSACDPMCCTDSAYVCPEGIRDAPVGQLEADPNLVGLPCSSRPAEDNIQCQRPRWKALVLMLVLIQHQHKVAQLVWAIHASTGCSGCTFSCLWQEHSTPGNSTAAAAWSVSNALVSHLPLSGLFAAGSILRSPSVTWQSA
jgi:hypothetical protein